jgi:hypothetical protein
MATLNKDDQEREEWEEFAQRKAARKARAAVNRTQATPSGNLVTVVRTVRLKLLLQVARLLHIHPRCLLVPVKTMNLTPLATQCPPVVMPTPTCQCPVRTLSVNHPLLSVNRPLLSVNRPLSALSVNRPLSALWATPRMKKPP